MLSNNASAIANATLRALSTGAPNPDSNSNVMDPLVGVGCSVVALMIILVACCYACQRMNEYVREEASKNRLQATRSYGYRDPGARLEDGQYNPMMMQ